MGFFRVLIHSILSFQLAASGTTIESTKLNKLTDALYDFAVAESMLVRTPEDFDRLYLGGFRPDDRKQIYERIRTLKKFPTFRRKNDLLVMDDGLVRIEIKWNNLHPFDFTINGAKWTYDLTQNLVPQLDALKKSQSHASYFWRAVFPEAEAQPIPVAVVKALLSNMGTAAATAAVAASVWAFITGPASAWSMSLSCKMEMNKNLNGCLEIKKGQKAAALADAPKFDAVYNMSGSDKRNILSKFEGQDWVCPAENDGKPREYRGRIRPTEMVDGKQVPTSKWVEVEAKLTAKGVPTDFVFSKEGSDPKTLDPLSIEGAKNLITEVSFDATELKPIKYLIPNPDRPLDETLGDSPEAPTKSLDRNMALSSKETADMKMFDDMIEFLNWRNYKCVEEKVTQDQAEGKDPGSPAAPKKVSDTTTVTQ